MEASLTCAVCLGVFREPVTLPCCSHNFCKNCVIECASPQSWTSLVQPSTDPYSSVTCPLCRKVSTLAGGIKALPVNTTLAEIVRLLSENGRAKEDKNADSTKLKKNSCPEHPEHMLELFCRSCEHACCGKCVSLQHQGIFHSVNLLDMVFQEEKLTFFNNLKILREQQKTLAEEISDDEKKAESILKANEDSVMSAFGEVQKALDMKKRQLLDVVKQHQRASIKRSQVRKVTKSHQKSTIDSLLKACEVALDDNNPRSFLQVACGLNKRMKSNLELMEFCSDHSRDMLKIEQQYIDVKAVLDAVSAMNITSSSNDVCRQNGSASFKSIFRTWNAGMTTDEKYSPVQDQELVYLQGQMQKMTIRFVCITKMPAYQHLSYEELRLKYYEPSVVQERQTPLVTPTRVKRQDAFDWECRALGRGPIFKEAFDLGRVKQMDNLLAYARQQDKPVGTQACPIPTLGGLPSNIKGGTPKLCSDISDTGMTTDFCLGKSDIATTKKSSKNEKSCKKIKSPCSKKLLSSEPVASTSAMVDKSANGFSGGAASAEEDMSVNSGSSEEFYDANCNIDPDVEEPCDLRSSSHNSADNDESSTQRSSRH